MKDRQPSKIKNEGRRHAIRFAGFIIAFCILFCSLQLLLSPDCAYTKEGEPILNGARYYTRLMVYEMYESKDNIDMLFLGSSHTYWQYDPSIIDEYLDVHSFNAGSSAQNLDLSYALLVEAGKKNSIDTVFLELCPARKGIVYSERTDLELIYLVSDYMHFGLNKIRFLLKASKAEYYVNSFFPLLRNKKNYLNHNYVKNVVKRNSEKDYIKYHQPVNPTEADIWYVDRGFLKNINRVENEDWKTKDRFAPIKDEMFSSEEMGCLEDIAGYCRDNGIRLIIISTPLTDFNLSQYGNYDSGREQIAQFAEENELEFYDFNLCRPEYFTFEGTKFFDPAHMNSTGAEEYSELIGRFFSGQISPDDLFYDSYEEKLEAMGSRVFGLAYTIDTGGDEKIVHFDPVASAEFPVYASIRTVSAGGEEKNISEKQILEDLHFDKSETGTIIVEILGDDPEGDITNTIHIEY